MNQIAKQMKTKIQHACILFCLLAVSLAGAAVPNGINYQGVARDNAGVVLANHNLKVKIGIREASPSLKLQWEESQTVTTNAYGQFTVVIGQGASTQAGASAGFSSIPWELGNLQLDVTIDFGSGDIFLGRTSILSAPYALYAERSGTAGPQGIQGAKGDVGATGAQGIQGEKGDIGLTGAQGIQGAKGDIGATGAQGIQGEKGDKGEKGDVGATGAQGIQGEKGDKGEKGDIGLTGAQGIQGAKGDVGATGAQGIQGEKGDKGDKGEKGDVGATGAQGIQGAKGDVGATGAQGIQGAKGDVGATGAQGIQGAKGDVGATGAQGIQGIPGVSGWEMLTVTSAVNSTSPKTQDLSCSTGKKILSGGGYISAGVEGSVAIQGTYPLAGGTTWRVSAAENDATTWSWSVTVYVICGTVQP